jgi:MoxR-like ATPase
MLLLGEPGLGKTYFAKKLAHALSTGFEFVSMSSLTAGWVLTGASAQWHNARPGKVAQTLIEGEYANPVVVLDEVDKAGGDARYDPMGALYSLLEPDTAAHFKDEFIDVDMDASHILWVATANDESVIPEPILNRMNVYSIERPDPEGARVSRSPSTAKFSMRTIGRFRASRRNRSSNDSQLFRPATCANCCSMLLGPRDSPTAISSSRKISTQTKLCGRRLRVGF